MMVCSNYSDMANGQPIDMIYRSCDASDGTVLQTISVSGGTDKKKAIKHDDAIA